MRKHRRSKSGMNRTQKLKQRSIGSVEENRQHVGFCQPYEARYVLVPLGVGDAAPSQVYMRNLTGRKDAQHMARFDPFYRLFEASDVAPGRISPAKRIYRDQHVASLRYLSEQ